MTGRIMKRMKHNRFDFTNHFPERMRLGAIRLYDLRVMDIQKLEHHIQERVAKIRSDYETKKPEGYFSSRKLYREFGIDPTRYRPSSEALWRRVRKERMFTRRDPLVDLTNLLALEYQISFGLYDLDKIRGPIVAGAGTFADRYQSLGRGMIHLEGKIVLSDQRGAFGNPSSDSMRTCIDHRSRNILQVLFFHRDYSGPKQVLNQTVQRFSGFFSFSEAEKGLY